MDQTWKNSMRGSISEVLGTMFFSPVDFDDSASSSDIFSKFKSSGFIKCMISISGEISTKVLLAIPKDTLEEMSADFTGKNEVNDEDVNGTLKEMLNMICGEALAESYGDKDYVLGIPEIIDNDLAEKCLKENSDAMTLLKGNLLNGEIAVISI